MHTQESSFFTPREIACFVKLVQRADGIQRLLLMMRPSLLASQPTCVSCAWALQKHLRSMLLTKSLTLPMVGLSRPAVDKMTPPLLESEASAT